MLVEAPETPGLSGSESQPRHLEKLTTYSSNDFLNPNALVHSRPQTGDRSCAPLRLHRPCQARAF